MKKLGKNQLGILSALAGGYPDYYERPYPGGGWQWGSRSATIRLLDPLVRRGLVRVHDGSYRLTEAGWAVAEAQDGLLKAKRAGRKDTASESAGQCCCCKVTGPASRFSPDSDGNLICTSALSCQLRMHGYRPAGMLPDLAGDVARELDSLSSYQLACIVLMLRAVSDKAVTLLDLREDREAALDAAHADYGCRACGAIGSEPCRTPAGAVTGNHPDRVR